MDVCYINYDVASMMGYQHGLLAKICGECNSITL